MPTRKKPALRGLPKIPKVLVQQLTDGPMTAEALGDASHALKKALTERALSAEFGHCLGYPPDAKRPEDETIQRYGKSGKSILTGN